MFAARVRASLKPWLRGRHSSYLSRSCGIAASSRRVLLERYNNDEESGNGLGSNRGFHSSSPRCYSPESDVGVKTHISAFEDDFFSELGSVKKDRNSNMVVELLTKMPEPFQVEKPELSQETKSRKTKKKKHEQASDSTFKPKLLTEKPKAYWKTNGKSKAGTHASSPARHVTDSISKPTELSSPVPDHESKAQISPCPEEENKTTSNGSSTSEIHSRCLSIGSLESLLGLMRTVLTFCFRARNTHEEISILEKLTDATVDHSQWTAEIASEA